MTQGDDRTLIQSWHDSPEETNRMPDPTHNPSEEWLTEPTAVLLDSLAAGATPDLIDGQFLVTLSLTATDGGGDTSRLPWLAMTPGQARVMIRSLAEALLTIAATQAHKATGKPAAPTLGRYAN